MFIAIDCNNKEEISNIQQMILNSIPSINGKILKAVDPGNLHFTLFFFGEVDDKSVEQIKNKMNEITFQSFHIIYKQIGAFPSFKFPKVIWIGLDENSTRKLISIFELVRFKMEQIGFKPDKQFKPHLTLFRVKKPIANIKNCLTKYTDFIAGSDKIDKIHLKKSELFQSGPVYSNIMTIFAK
jgi:RNA 2',3'-cyclic 3'-phosphodiesterase